MSAAEISQALGGRRYGGGYLCRCPAHDDGKPSLSLKDSPTTGKLLVNCFGGCEGREIIAALQQRGLLPGGNGEPYQCPKPNPAAEEKERRRRASILQVARRIWHEAKPAPGTPVEKYLRARGFDGPIPETLRYHGALKHSSDDHVYIHGMVGAILIEGSPVIAGIHRTFLSPDATWKTDKFPDKAMLGEAWTGSVRLGPYAEEMAVSEGVETGLSMQQEMGLSTWAGLTAGGLAALILPPLPYAKKVLIAADHDKPSAQHPRGHGLEAAETAKARWEAEGRSVRIMMPREQGQDFNDVLRAARAKLGMSP